MLQNALKPLAIAAFNTSYQQKIAAASARPQYWSLMLQQSVSTTPTAALTRRCLLTAGVLLPHPVVQRLLGQPSAQAAEVVRVGPGQAHETIAAAVAAAPPGSTVLIEPGRYEEQLVLTTSITLAAAQRAGSVLITCNTQQPYRHCLEMPGSSSSQGITVTVQGLSFQHYSKSVANNYCVFAQAGSLRLEQCDITSQSGVGVGVEGAAVVLAQCSIHDCERHGVAAFGSLEGAPGRCEVSDCSITSNKLNGILAKDGAELSVLGSSISGNGGYGVQLADCTAELRDNTISRNKQGSVALQLGTVTVDEGELGAQNSLFQGVALL